MPAITDDVSVVGDYTPPTASADTPPFALNHARILYDNLLLDSSISVTAGNNPSYVLIPNTAQRYTFTGTQTITVTLPIATLVDTLCFGAHNLSDSIVTVSSSPDLVSGYSVFSAARTIENNNAIMIHREGNALVRRLQIVITCTGDKHIGSIYAGIALQMMRPFYSGHSPSVLSRRTDFYSSNTESGNYIGVQVRRRALESSADWKNLTDAWYRTYFDPFLVVAETLPFYFAWNLLEHPNDVSYCKNITDISPSYQGQLTLMSVSIPLIGIA